MGETMGVRDPSPECRIRITLPTGHIQVPTRHGDKRRTEPSRHRAATRLLALPPTVAQVDGGPGRTSPSTEGRGGRGTAYALSGALAAARSHTTNHSGG